MTGITDVLLLDRMVSAVEKVRERLLRATGALDRAAVPYAIIGGNAVASWVATVDEGAVRNTRDVDILLNRGDCVRAETALKAASMDILLDGPETRVRDAIHVLFAGEKVRPGDVFPAPDIGEGERTAFFRVLSLEALVRVKLSIFRDKDRTHLRDMLDVGLIDGTWKARYPLELAERLQLLIDTPEG